MSAYSAVFLLKVNQNLRPIVYVVLTISYSFYEAPARIHNCTTGLLRRFMPLYQKQPIHITRRLLFLPRQLWQLIMPGSCEVS